MIGIIGGSGLDNPDILKDSKEREVSTSYGKPSSPIKTGKIKGVDVAILARHGREHTIPPTHVNNKANVAALKELGCKAIIATTAVGSLRKDIKRGDLVILDQFIDFTRRRDVSFHEEFEPHNPSHAAMAEPFSKELRAALIKACEELKLPHHKTGTVITIEGSRFSTKAESKMFRSWGADVINMSIAPECILANEAGMPYAAVAMSTDYDCLFDDVEPVTWEDVFKVFKQNVDKVTSLLARAAPKIRMKA
ncbi:S-methyl-5'-thioadenosine phosphorylase [Candidatus Woesearchaeota archaeon]|nr:S-methyl-5'-thioadenosine phosphorylase [Candidatus Woesearchaeota archaeon]